MSAPFPGSPVPRGPGPVGRVLAGNTRNDTPALPPASPGGPMGWRDPSFLVLILSTGPRFRRPVWKSCLFKNAVSTLTPCLESREVSAGAQTCRVSAGPSGDPGPPRGPWAASGPPCSGPGRWGLGVSPAVSPQVTGWRGGRKPRAETGSSEKHALLSPCPALRRHALEGPALPSALTRAGGGARGLGPRGSSWTGSDPVPGAEGGRTGRVGGGQGCRGRRVGTLGPLASESVVAERGGGREAALGGVLPECIPVPPTWPGHVTARKAPSTGLLCERRACGRFRARRKVPSRQFLQSQTAFLPTLHCLLLPSSFQKGDSAEKAASL